MQAEHSVNPAAFIAKLVAIALILGFLGLALFFYSPRSIGLVQTEYLANEAYAFQSFEFRAAYLGLTFELGQLVPVLRNGEVSGAVILGPGRFVLEYPASLQGQISSAYLPLTYGTLQQFRDQFSLQDVDTAAPLEMAQATLDLRDDFGTTIKLFGVARQLESNNLTQSVFVFGPNGFRLRYAEGEQVVAQVAVDGQERTFAAANTGDQVSPFLLALATSTVTPLAMAIFVAISLLIGALIIIATIDLPPHYPLPASQLGLRWSLGLILVTAGISYLTGYLHLPSVFQTLLTLIMGGGTLVLQRRYREELRWSWTGWTLKRSLVLAVVVGTLMVITGALSFPSALRSSSAAQFITLLLHSLLIYGLAREVFWRGLVQNILMRSLGVWPGLLLASWLQGIITSVPRLATDTYSWGTLLWEGLVTIPVTALILGILYNRTRSLAGNAVASGWAYFLSRILRF